MLDMTRHFTEIGITTLSMTTLLIAGDGYLVCASPNRLGAGTFLLSALTRRIRNFWQAEMKNLTRRILCTLARLHACTQDRN
jgi:hypothetical protein